MSLPRFGVLESVKAVALLKQVLGRRLQHDFAEIQNGLANLSSLRHHYLHSRPGNLRAVPRPTDGSLRARPQGALRHLQRQAIPSGQDLRDTEGAVWLHAEIITVTLVEPNPTGLRFFIL